MPGAAYESSAKLKIQVVPQSPHTFAYVLWRALPGETEWTKFDQGTKNTPAKEFGPFPVQTKLAYSLLIGGNANTDWKIQVATLQHGNSLECSPPVETGFMTGTVARRDTAFVLA